MPEEMRDSPYRAWLNKEFQVARDLCLGDSPILLFPCVTLLDLRDGDLSGDRKVPFMELTVEVANGQ